MRVVSLRRCAAYRVLMFSRQIKKTVKSASGLLAKKILKNDSCANKNLILMYHRVADRLPTDLHDPAMYVRTDTLEMHLKELSRLYEIVPLERVINPGAQSRNHCAITFDDGWLDNYEVAFPVLKKYGVPATIFLPVELIGSSDYFWFQSVLDLANIATRTGKSEQFVRYYSKHAPAWNNKGLAACQVSGLILCLKSIAAPALHEITLDAYRELGYRPADRRDLMNWEQICEMSKHGISFGSHGTRHNIFTTLDDSAKRHEIVDSLTLLRNKEINMTLFLSYPNGNYDYDSVLLAKHAGYQGAVTTELGFNTADTDHFLLKRIAMHDEISNTPALFWFRIWQAVLSTHKAKQFVKNENPSHY